MRQISIALAAFIFSATALQAAHCPQILPVVMKVLESAKALREARDGNEPKRKQCALAQQHYRNNEAAIAAFKRAPKHCIHNPSASPLDAQAREQAEVRAII